MSPGSAARRAVKAAALVGAPVTRRRTGDVVVLLYHRVGAGHREIDLPLDLFRRHLEALVEGDRVLALDAALAEGSGGVVVTFDDGYGDFHRHVLPLLVQHRVPATLYLATSLVAGEGEADPEDPLTWSQLREAVATGLVTVGGHTHSHADLSRATRAQAEAEMRRCQELVEDRLGVPCRHFAYPWAVGSREADAVARRLFDSAALDAWRTNRAGRVDPHRLGRTPVLRSDGTRFFRAKARGWLDAEALAYRALGRGPWARQ